jgi:hypothetical protein
MPRFPWRILQDHRHPDPGRTKRLGTMLAVACLLMMFVPPLFVAGYVSLADADFIATSVNLPPNIIQSELVTWQRAAGVLVMEIPALFVSLGMWQARECFLAFANGTSFTPGAVQNLRRFAGWMLAATIADVLIIPVMSVLLTANNPVQHVLTIAVGSDHLLMLPRIAMMWLLAVVIGQGQGMVRTETTTTQLGA